MALGTETQLKRIELYAQARVEGKNKSDAFRVSHPHCVKNKWKSETINNKAYAFDKLGEVQARIKDLQEEHKKRHEITIDSITTELNENRKLAKDYGQIAAMNTATLGKAKLHGLITEKHEHGGKDGGPIEVTSVERIVVCPKNTNS